MKLILSVLLSIPAFCIFSQDLQFTVSANNKTFTMSPDNDNANNLLLISSIEPDGNNFLTIHVVNEEIDKDWKRSFSVYDSTGNAIKDLTLMKDGSYCIKLNELKILLHPQQDYAVYTTAIPKDPKKAMLVKVARTFICKIRIL